MRIMALRCPKWETRKRGECGGVQYDLRKHAPWPADKDGLGEPIRPTTGGGSRADSLAPLLSSRCFPVLSPKQLVLRE